MPTLVRNFLLEHWEDNRLLFGVQRARLLPRWNNTPVSCRASSSQRIPKGGIMTEKQEGGRIKINKQERKEVLQVKAENVSSPDNFPESRLQLSYRCIAAPSL